MLARYGVINPEIAEQIALDIRKLTTLHEVPTTWGISTTGIAGPDPQDDKPVDVVYIDIASADWSYEWGPRSNSYRSIYSAV